MEVIDINNNIPSYSILPACFSLEKSYMYFPGRSVFLVVVDPGVGTDRNILLVQHNNRFFIGPDNGVLTPILTKEDKTVWVLDNKDYFIIDGYSTFEARDKMAPIAAHLGTGVNPGVLARAVTEYRLLQEYYPQKSGFTIDARIVYIDKFGNLMTNVTKEFLLDTMEASGLSNFKVMINRNDIKDYYETYGHAGKDPFLMIGSHQNLEIAMKQKSAAVELEAAIGQRAAVSFY